MQMLRKIWDDVRQGENVDVYLTIVISLLLAGLNIFGVTPPSVINSLSLAILTLLAISLLGNRFRLDRLIEESQTSIDQILLKEFPDSTQEIIVNRMINAKDLLLVGTDLYRTLQMHYHLLENRLGKGKSIRVILVNSVGTACEVLAKRRYRPITAEDYALFVKNTLQAFRNLKQETAGQLEIRVIDYPIDRGGVFVDTDTADGKIFIWNHGYRTKEVARPKLELDVSDGYWFKFFADEAHALWNNSTEWQDE